MPVILAPTAAGKSRLVRSCESVGINDVLDGDHVIRDTIGWPKIHRWWEVMSEAEKAKFHAACGVEIVRASKLGKVVLFNGKPFTIARKQIAALWMPSEFEHRRNGEARAASGNTSQPSRWDELLGNRKYLGAWARENRIPFMDTIAVLRFVAKTNRDLKNLKDAFLTREDA